MPACEVAIDLGLHGPVSASALACASGTYALLEARRWILAGEADVVLAGGADAAVTAVDLRRPGQDGTAVGAQRRSRRRPAARLTPTATASCSARARSCWSSSPPSHAAARGARSYGSVAGGALTCDAFHISAPQPSGADAARAISLALQRAGVAPERARLHLRTRHRDPGQRCRRDPGDPDRARRRRRPRPGQLAQVDDRPPDRRRRGAVGDDLPAGHARQRDPADHQPAHARPRVRPRLRAADGPPGAGPHRDRQRVRLRRPELRRRPARPAERALRPAAGVSEPAASGALARRRPQHRSARRSADAMPSTPSPSGAGRDRPRSAARSRARRR